MFSYFLSFSELPSPASAPSAGDHSPPPAPQRIPDRQTSGFPGVGFVLNRQRAERGGGGGEAAFFFCWRPSPTAEGCAPRLGFEARLTTRRGTCADPPGRGNRGKNGGRQRGGGTGEEACRAVIGAAQAAREILATRQDSRSQDPQGGGFPGRVGTQTRGFDLVILGSAAARDSQGWPALFFFPPQPRSRFDSRHAC